MRWASSSRRRDKDRSGSRELRDDLTGLYTRSSFVERCGEALVATQHGATPALLLVEVDGVAATYDVGGHPAGDELVRLVAHRISREVGSLATVTRLADHEFAVLFHHLPDHAVVLDLAYRIVSSVAGPVTLSSQRHAQLYTSCGIITWETLPPGAQPHDLLRGAGLAVQEARRGGRNGIEVCTSSMLAIADERLAIGRDLRQALAEQGLGVCYQPLVELDTGTVVGFEALVRWTHPVHGTVSPTRFVPLAEEFGLITELGRMVLSTATAQVQQWSESFGVPLTAHVNVSGLDLAADGFLDMVAGCLRECDLDPSQLVLEVTQGAVLPDLETARSQFVALHDLGVRIAIDDFGSGASAVGFLQDLEVDIVKVDRSLFDAEDSQRAENMLRGVIALGQALGVQVYGEGIEDEADRVRLERHGCGTGQGYLFSPPLPPGDAGAYLRAHLVASSATSA